MLTYFIVLVSVFISGTKDRMKNNMQTVREENVKVALYIVNRMNESKDGNLVASKFSEILLCRDITFTLTGAEPGHLGPLTRYDTEYKGS